MELSIAEGRFRLWKKIGSGNHGAIFLGTETKTATEVAIKLECKRQSQYVKNEYKVLQQLQGLPGIPRTLWLGEEGDYNIMVMELLGPNLTDLEEYCGHKLSLKTVLALGLQLFRVIQAVHSKGYLHLGIKPQNLVMGLGAKALQVHLIDFAYARKLSNPALRGSVDKPEPKMPWKGLGDPHFTSVNSHARGSLGGSDDLESIGYVLVHHLKGLPFKTSRGSRTKIRSNKEQCSLAELCNGLPPEFFAYMSYVRSLGSQDTPDYEFLVTLFEGLMQRSGFYNDCLFDWTVAYHNNTGKVLRGQHQAAPTAGETAAVGKINTSAGNQPAGSIAGVKAADKGATKGEEKVQTVLLIGSA